MDARRRIYMSDVQRVLITGGCGFIGANLVRLLRDRTDWSLRVVDDMRTGRPEAVEGLADLHEATWETRPSWTRCSRGSTPWCTWQARREWPPRSRTRCV